MAEHNEQDSLARSFSSPFETEVCFSFFGESSICGRLNNARFPVWATVGVAITQVYLTWDGVKTTNHSYDGKYLPRRVPLVCVVSATVVPLHVA